MKKLFVILGKSSTGKDSILKYVIKYHEDSLYKIIPYTTRPIRSNEMNGKDYNFVTEEQMNNLKSYIIVTRCYDSYMGGKVYYFTVIDDAFYRSNKNGIIIGTLESLKSFKEKLADKLEIVPIYITVDDYTIISRSIEREKSNNGTNYKEICRRFIADCEDFSDERLKEAGINRGNTFKNYSFSTCTKLIENYMGIG